MDVPTEDWTWDDFVDAANEISANARRRHRRTRPARPGHPRHLRRAVHRHRHLRLGRQPRRRRRHHPAVVRDGAGARRGRRASRPERHRRALERHARPHAVRHRQGGHDVRVQQPDQRLRGRRGRRRADRHTADLDRRLGHLGAAVAVLGDRVRDEASRGRGAARGLAAQPARGGRRSSSPTAVCRSTPTRWRSSSPCSPPPTPRARTTSRRCSKSVSSLPRSPRAARILNELSQRIESDILFGKTSRRGRRQAVGGRTVRVARERLIPRTLVGGSLPEPPTRRFRHAATRE